MPANLQIIEFYKRDIATFVQHVQNTVPIVKFRFTFFLTDRLHQKGSGKIYQPRKHPSMTLYMTVC